MKKRQFWGMAVAVCVALVLVLAGCDNPTGNGNSNGNGNDVVNDNGNEANGNDNADNDQVVTEVDRTRTVKMRDGGLVFNINYTVKEGAETPASVLNLIARFEAMDSMPPASGAVIVD